MSSPKIILYTNRGCPWAHRAHIALKESGLDYEEVTIDLDTPREPWYLEVNHVCDVVKELGTIPPSPCPDQIRGYTNVLTYMLPAWPCSQPVIQRRDHHRVRHCCPIHR